MFSESVVEQAKIISEVDTFSDADKNFSAQSIPYLRRGGINALFMLFPSVEYDRRLYE